jgi:hypothetical protein
MREAAIGANVAARLTFVPRTGRAGTRVEGKAALCGARRPTACSIDRRQNDVGSCGIQRPPRSLSGSFPSRA